MVLKYQFPFPIEWYDPDDEFGNTRPPWRTPATPHRGADFNKSSAGQSGTAIPSIAAGVVRYSGWRDGLGYMVSIQHPDGYFSGYCHMVSSPPVAIGETVSRGQTVGKIGGTAGPGDFSYAPHLHLTMGTDVNGTQGGASRFDPIPFIQARLNGDDPGTTPIIKEQDLPKIISVPGGTIAFVSETYGRKYTSVTGGQGFSIGSNRAVYGEVGGLTDDQVTTLINEANARGQRIADLAKA